MMQEGIHRIFGLFWERKGEERKHIDPIPLLFSKIESHNIRNHLQSFCHLLQVLKYLPGVYSLGKDKM